MSRKRLFISLSAWVVAGTCIVMLLMPRDSSSSASTQGALRSNYLIETDLQKNVTDVELIVDASNSLASNKNAGTASDPLLTIQEAVKRARTNKMKDISTTVTVMPGVYREKILLAWTNRPENQPDNSTPIVIRAFETGTVRVTGSDVWDNWEYNASDDILEHEWTNNWGEFDPGWELGGLAARREMIFVNGVLMRQVETEAPTEANTFSVDESNDRIRLKLDPDIRMSAPIIEVAVRDVIWDQRFENGVTIDGFRFDHAATPWKGGQGAVRFTSCKDVTVVNSSFHYNNWVGLFVGESEEIHLRNLVMNDNGGQGWNTWRVTEFDSYNTETSYNNWRGALSEFNGWSVGNKLESMHGVRIRKHRAVGNLSRGLWLDYDIQNAVLDSMYIADNQRDGIWIEANPGPIEIIDSEIVQNKESGIRSTFSENVTIIGNLIADNELRQLEIAGKNRRWVKDFVSKERINLTVRNWTVLNNEFAGGKQLIGVASNLKYKEWIEFVRTLESNDNTFRHENLAAFLVLQKTLSLIEARSVEDFKGWQEHTGQDSSSTFLQYEHTSSQ